jgi:hypothetical protein
MEHGNLNYSETANSDLGAVMRSAFSWAVTGTFHGSIIEAETEGEARRIFHKHYNGESITHIKKRNIHA